MATLKPRTSISGEIPHPPNIRFATRLARLSAARMFEACYSVGCEAEELFVLCELLMTHTIVKSEEFSYPNKETDHRKVLVTMANNAANLLDAAVVRANEMEKQLEQDSHSAAD